MSRTPSDERQGVATAVSPSGTNVYVALEDGPSVAVFDRDVGTGKMTFVQLLVEGESGVSGLGGPNAVVVTPDGADVLVTNSTTNAVVVFRRNLVSGLLTFLEAEIDGVGGVDGLALATEARVSPDGAHVYIAGRGDDLVAVFARDAGSGALTFVETQGTAGTLDDISSLDVSPDGLHVYAGGTAGSAIFSRDDTTGELTLIESAATSFPRKVIRVSPDGDHVYMAVDGTGLSSDGAIHGYDRDPVTGLLVLSEVLIFTDPTYTLMSGFPVALEVSPDGEFLVVADRNFLIRFDRDPGTGNLTSPDFDQIDSNGISFPIVAPLFRLAWSPDSAQILVATRDSPFVIAWDALPGLTPTTLLNEADAYGLIGPAGLDRASDAVVSPDGNHVYITSTDKGGAVLAFERDPADGDLLFIEQVWNGVLLFDGLEGAESVAVSPDGAHLYVAAESDDSVAVLARDPGTGTMSFVEMEKDGVGGVDGLDRAGSVAVSPDGAHVYATGRLDDSVAVFERDGLTGELTFVEVERDGVGGVDGLDAPGGIAVSADGEHVYAASADDRAVAVFERDSITGELTFVEAESHEVGGSDAGSRFPGLVVSPDGAFVYVLGETSDAAPALAVLERNATTGELTFERTYLEALGGVHGLSFFDCVEVSADGSYLVAGRATFARNPATGALAFIEAHDSFCPLGVSPDGRNVYDRFNWFQTGLPQALDVRVVGFTCAAEPLASCRDAQKASVSVSASVIPAKSKLKLSLTGADPTTLAELDPGTTNAYAACLYDESGTPELVLDLLIPAVGDCRKDVSTVPKPCWTVSSKKASYSDRYLTPSGVKTVKLTASAIQKTSIQISGLGEFLPSPGLPYGLPVRLQVQNADGICWEAVLSNASKNEDDSFKAKFP